MTLRTPALAVLLLASATIGCNPQPGATDAPTTAATTVARPSPSETTATVSPSTTLSVGRGPAGPTQAATVIYVTDGDTIHVELDGSEERVRYIGIDAPESVARDQPVERGGPEASHANSDLVSGQQVYLERDVSDTDQYGRLLRYVWLHTDAGWVMVNRQLVLEGWAEVKTYRPDTKYQEILYAAQDQAKAAHAGIWGPIATP